MLRNTITHYCINQAVHSQNTSKISVRHSLEITGIARQNFRKCFIYTQAPTFDWKGPLGKLLCSDYQSRFFSDLLNAGGDNEAYDP